MARQVGTYEVRISWTRPFNRPSVGYRIRTGDTRPTGSFSAGTSIASTASSHVVGQAPGTSTYWLVALFGTPIVVGPVNATIRGEEMCT